MKTSSQSKVVLSQLMGIQDSNHYGNVHGGVLMKLCDEAGGMAAVKHAGGPAVTVVVDSMTFDAPVHIGNLVTFTAQVTWVGNTSIEARVIVTAEDILTGEVTHTNSAYFLYVALDKQGKSKKVSELVRETAEEEQLWLDGIERQKMRLVKRVKEEARQRGDWA